MNKKDQVKENDIKEDKIDIKSNDNNGENDSIVEETQTYDYDDIDRTIVWSEIFSKEQESYSIYFYNKTRS